MKREEILEDCPEGFEDELKNIIDYFETKFGEIRDLLDIDGISELDKIEDAHRLAGTIADDLY